MLGWVWLGPTCCTALFLSCWIWTSCAAAAARSLAVASHCRTSSSHRRCSVSTPRPAPTRARAGGARADRTLTISLPTAADSSVVPPAAAWACASSCRSRAHSSRDCVNAASSALCSEYRGDDGGPVLAVPADACWTRSRTHRRCTTDQDARVRAEDSCKRPRCAYRRARGMRRVQRCHHLSWRAPPVTRTGVRSAHHWWLLQARTRRGQCAVALGAVVRR